MSEHLLRLEEASIRLALSSSSMRRLVASGELPSIKIGRLRMVRESDLDQFIAERGQPVMARAEPSADPFARARRSLAALIREG